MKKTITSPLILLAASLGTALLSVIVRVYLTLTQLDVKYGVYAGDSILPTVFHITLAAVLILLAIVAFFVAPKRSEKYTCPNSNSNVFISSTVAFMLLADLLFSLYYILASEEKPSTFDILEILFCIPAAIFFLTFLLNKAKNSALRIFFSFFPTAWCTVCLIRVYFDTTALNTSPNKTLCEIALLAAMLYFLNESRSLLGIFSHRFYLAAATVAPVLLFSSSIPNLLFPTKLFISESDSFLRYTINAAFALFIWIRYAAYVKSPKESDQQ